MKYLAIIGIVTVLWAGSTSQYLSRLNQPARENALIQLERNGQPTENMIRAAYLWTTGRFVKAISLIKEIEEESGDLVFIINYRNPVITQNPRWADDVMVNVGYYNYSKVELLLSDSLKLFIVAKGESLGHYAWNVYKSSDGGYNWARTTQYNAQSNVLYDCDAAEVPGYIYVAYAYSDDPHVGKLRRVYASSGAMDTVFGYVNAFTIAGNIHEVSLEPNRIDWDQLYYGVICDLNVLHYFYANDPTSWFGIATYTNNAKFGLDMDYGYMAGSSHYLWMSYINTDDYLCARARTSGSWGVHDQLDFADTVLCQETAIAQRSDSVIICYTGDGWYCPYMLTYDDGTSWAGGLIDTNYSSAVDVTARGNEGWHVSWATWSDTDPEDVYYRTRTYAPGTWSTPELVSEHDQHIYYKTSIEYLGTPGAYGIAYIDDNFDIYFDRIDWTGVAEHAPVDFFSQRVSLTPNPSSNQVNLSITLNTEGTITISMFDVAGRLLKKLMDETQPAGTHTLTLDTQNLTAGTYFIRIETKDGITTKKMTLVR
jgi:hypothetical protein